MQEIKKVGILSVAKIGLLFGVLLGLVLGIVMAFVSQYAPLELASSLPVSDLLTGLKAIIIAPLFYGIFYFIAGIVGAALYNLFSGWVGGVKVDFKK